MAIPTKTIAISIMLTILLGCGDTDPQSVRDAGPPFPPLPSVIKSFVEKHPELDLSLSDAEAIPGWPGGERWRARNNGEILILYEKDGRIESIKRADQTYLWVREDR